jgi:AmmeMemoRadiSam system protein A
VTGAYTKAEALILLATARHAIAARLGLAREPAPEPSARLQEKRGAFVTLRTRAAHELRGCVGFVEPRFALIETVARAAEAAAFHDGRFEPVRASELAGLVIDVSVLSPPQPIRAEDVVVGRHGLILRHAGRSGLLLPQVPGELGWDREAFLEATCRKAGLASGAWKEAGAQLLGFTAVVIDEEAG